MCAIGARGAGECLLSLWLLALPPRRRFAAALNYWSSVVDPNILMPRPLSPKDPGQADIRFAHCLLNAAQSANSGSLREATTLCPRGSVPPGDGGAIGVAMQDWRFVLGSKRNCRNKRPGCRAGINPLIAQRPHWRGRHDHEPASRQQIGDA